MSAVRSQLVWYIAIGAATRRYVRTASIYSCKGPPCVLVKRVHKSMFDILRDGVAISSFGKSHRQYARGPRTVLDLETCIGKRSC